MKEQLKKYGFSEKEAEVYLACLKLGDSTANRLSEVSNIRRTTVYEILESLKKKGVISSLRKNNKYFFSAVRPKVLIDLLKEKERLVKEILPELNDLTKAISEKPKIELFEGISGIKSAVMKMLDYKEILSYGASKKGDEIFDSFIENFARKRTDKKIMLKGVFEKGFPEHMTDKKIKRYTKIRTISKFKNHNSVYFIYGNELLIITLGQELIAIRITSPLLVTSHKKVFEILWDVAK